MKKALSKTEVEKQITNFFNNIKNKSPKEIKKIKRLAMKYNIKLKERRKLFCNKCLNSYLGNENIRIKNNKKIIKCNNCKNISRWRINSF